MEKELREYHWYKVNGVFDGRFEEAFDKEGQIALETDAYDEDVLYDDISSGLLVNEIRRKRQELFQSLELYYRVFILKENIDGLLEE